MPVCVGLWIGGYFVCSLVVGLLVMCCVACLVLVCLLCVACAGFGLLIAGVLGLGLCVGGFGWVCCFRGCFAILVGCTYWWPLFLSWLFSALFVCCAVWLVFVYCVWMFGFASLWLVWFRVAQVWFVGWHGAVGFDCGGFGYEVLLIVLQLPDFTHICCGLLVICLLWYYYVFKVCLVVIVGCCVRIVV